MSETKQHAIRFPIDLYEKLRILAELDDRNLNAEVVYAVRLIIADYERRNGPIAVTPPDNAPTPG